MFTNYHKDTHMLKVAGRGHVVCDNPGQLSQETYMKLITTCIVLALCAGLLSSCKTAPAAKDFPLQAEPRAEFRSVQSEELNPASQLAIIIFDLAKRGMLESLPDVRVNPQGRQLANTTDYSTFLQRTLTIVDAVQGPGDAYSQTMMSESVDR
jgi:hypothetical protein